MKYLLYGIFAAMLAATWWGLYVVMIFFTELVLAPWDMATILPAAGTLERIINDFFASGFGQYVPAITLMLVNSWFIMRAMQRRVSQLPHLLLHNLYLFGGLVLALLLSMQINNVLFPSEGFRSEAGYYGFHRSVAPFVCSLPFFMIWLRAQLRHTYDGRKRKRHSIQFDYAHARLALAETGSAEQSLPESQSMRRMIEK